MVNNLYKVDIAEIGWRNMQLPGEVSTVFNRRRRSQAPTLKLQRQRAEAIVPKANEPSPKG